MVPHVAALLPGNSEGAHGARQMLQDDDTMTAVIAAAMTAALARQPGSITVSPSVGHRGRGAAPRRAGGPSGSGAMQKE